MLCMYNELALGPLNGLVSLRNLSPSVFLRYPDLSKIRGCTVICTCTFWVLLSWRDFLQYQLCIVSLLTTCVYSYYSAALHDGYYRE